MDDLNTRRLRFDVEPRELVRLLKGYSKVKAGPFSWRTPSGKGEIGLYLDVRKSNRDGFECKVNTIRYRNHRQTDQPRPCHAPQEKSSGCQAG